MGYKLNNLISKSKLIVIGGAGHFVHQDRASIVANHIHNFINV
jgi:pimeloyl-ACP methyl ester carboxylesterase